MKGRTWERSTVHDVRELDDVCINGSKNKSSHVQTDREVNHTSCHLTEITLTSKHGLSRHRPTPRLSL